MADASRSRPDDPTLARDAPERKAEGTAHSRAEQETLPPPTAAPKPGGMDAMPERFGRYRIVRELGHGAMGSVYLAEDTELHRQVALKIPKFAQREDAELLERFYREARAAATLNHPNICQVHDIGEHEGIRYITMAYISGPSLSKLVGTPKLRSERTIAKLVRKMAVGLAQAHGKGILHRDLKPANILLDERNEPVITDFGLARQLESGGENQLTQTGMLLGTPAYMSPEQISGEPEKIGPASDVYALGVILYELLTGEKPYKGPVVAMISQIVQGRLKRPSELRQDLDKRLEAVCLKMMASSVDKRYSSAQQAAAALSHYLEQTAAGKQSGVAQATAPQANLEEEKQRTIGLLKQGKFDEASGRLQKFAGVGGAGAEAYTQWATAESARLKAMPKEVFEKGPELVPEAIKLLAQQDYAQVITVLEGVPDEYRSAEAGHLLKQARDLAAEADQLNARMNEAVRDGQYDGLREDVLERLLELEPGNLTARDIYEHLGTYGPGEKMRFDKAGMLLPARGKYWWLDHLAHLLSQRLMRRPVQRAKAGGRRKGEPIPADEAHSEVPVVPIAIGLGVVGLLLLTVVLILRTPKGTIVVQIDEPNAVVSVDDGKLQFTTTEDDQSIEIQLKKGEHTVTVTKDGHEPFTRRLLVKKGQTETIRIDLASTSIQETGAVASGGTVAGPETRPLSMGPPDAAKPRPTTSVGRNEDEVRVLLITGKTNVGDKGFFAMFDAMPGVRCTAVRYPAAAELLRPELKNDYDVIVLYDKAEGGLKPQQQQAFAALLQAGIGVVALHHTIVSHQDWMEYGKIIGGHYYLNEKSINGKTIPRSEVFTKMSELRVSVADAAHPITRGLQDFTIQDERFRNVEHDPDIQVLLTTDHPENDREVAWVKTYGNSRVFYLLFGHDHHAQDHPTYSDLVARGIRWAAEAPTQIEQELQPEPGFVSLFDGKTLNGWHGDPQLWRVESGAIVGSTDGKTVQQNSFLSTDRTYSNFVLKAKFKLRNGNSGIQFRSELHPDYVVKGYQADFTEQANRKLVLFDEGRRLGLCDTDPMELSKHYDPTGWNEYQITCDGPNIKLVLNGFTTAEYVEKDPQISREGVIAFQLFRTATIPSMQVSFKGIRIKELTNAADRQPHGSARVTPRSGTPPASVAGKTITLFDGKTLSGWRGVPDQTPFSVVDGAIKTSGRRGGMLYFVGDGTQPNEFSDFDLTMRVKTENEANSGVFFHCARGANGNYEPTFEAQIANQNKDPQKTGSLWSIEPVHRMPARDGIWFEYRIVVSGKTVTTYVDRQKVMEWTQPDNWTPPPKKHAPDLAKAPSDSKPTAPSSG